MDMKDELLTVSDEVVRRTTERLEGLTDDEHLWEPVPACWTVWERTDGDVQPDRSPRPEAPPFTTLAWRLWHLTECYGADRNRQWLRPDATDADEGDRGRPQVSAAAALAGLADARRWWRALLESLPEAVLAEKLGPVAGQYASETKAAFVLHQIDEQAHHSAEVALMRDLYAAVGGAEGALPARAPATPLQQVLGGRRPADGELAGLRAERPDLVRWAAANGYWRAVPLLVDAGFAVDDAQDGATALHYAAAAGELAAIRLLLDRGADPHRKDGNFHAAPAVWAEFFGRSAVAELLTTVAAS